MSESLKKPGIAAVLVIVAITAVVWALRPSRPPLDKSLHASVGRRMAEETAKQLGNQGAVVVVLPEASFKMPLVDSEFASFQKSLPRGIKIEAREKIRLQTVGPLSGMLTPQIYFELAGKHSSANAMVSFVGLGTFGEGDLARFGKGMPPIHVVSVNGGIPKEYLQKQLVRLAIIPRSTPLSAAGTGAVDSTSESFDRSYEIVALDSASNK